MTAKSNLLARMLVDIIEHYQCLFAIKFRITLNFMMAALRAPQI